MTKHIVASKSLTALARAAAVTGVLLGSSTMVRADDAAEERARAAEARAMAAEKRAKSAEDRLKETTRKQTRNRNAGDGGVDREAERDASRRLDEMITRQYMRDAGR